MAYYTNVGPKSGPILHRDGHDAIGVLQAPDNHWPIRMALGWCWDAEGRSTYKLTVHGAERPGRWIVVDRQSRPAPEEDRSPR
jgi:hypothetical protein